MKGTLVAAPKADRVCDDCQAKTQCAWVKFEGDGKRYKGVPAEHALLCVDCALVATEGDLK